MNQPHNDMSKATFWEKYESLPDNLKKQVEQYIDLLLFQESSMETNQLPDALETLIMRSKNPDPKAIWGLAKTHPINLEELRKQAWER